MMGQAFGRFVVPESAAMARAKQALVEEFGCTVPEFGGTLVEVFADGYLMIAVSARDEAVAWKSFQALKREDRVPFYSYDAGLRR